MHLNVEKEVAALQRMTVKETASQVRRRVRRGDARQQQGLQVPISASAIQPSLDHLPLSPQTEPAKISPAFRDRSQA
jgi:hypothetical protein